VAAEKVKQNIRDLATGPMPTAFDTRNVGSTLEIEPTSVRFRRIRARARDASPLFYVTKDDATLPSLPRIPLDDIGGWGMHASVIPPSTAPGGRVSIEIECLWDAAATIDLIAIVPSRNFDANGLDPHFGLPEDFTVHLIDASEEILPALATERSTGSHPTRRGHRSRMRLVLKANLFQQTVAK
jgi:hypothetical protein